MRVLHIDSEKTWRGGQQQAIYLYEGMLKRGFDCGFLCLPKSSLHNYLAKNNLPFHTISCKGELDLYAGFKLAMLCRKKSYDVLHLHSSHSLSWGLMAKLFCPHLKLVATRRVDFPIGKNPFSAFKYRTKAINKIVTVSNNIRNVLVDCGVPESKITVIHSGIDIKKFADKKVPENFRETWKIPEKSIVVGTVAAFAGHKDYPNFLQAASLAVKENPELFFMAVGDGILLPEMKKVAMELGLQGHISFTGFQKDIGHFLKAFDIFVLASYLEGLGTSVLEAMSVGLPVIGTKAGGISEMISNEENGLLVPPKNPQELSHSILKLASEPRLRQKYGKNALETVKQFDKELMVDKNLELYKTL
ncbi:MAG: glycosyltransferase family 4 protein [Candidatus Cloacimonetes bacterium]|nr:glycosyltransferase family 4 protein [Candidatus Cloacimonadota bacterium]MDD3868873.1 glycosyltransferase family 4 protein [Candidatus Cloacimonadota bacterium]